MVSTITVAAQETLLELAKALNNNDILSMAQVMNRVNKPLSDATMMEANNVGFHKSYIADTLPTGTLRRVNQGITKEAAIGRQQVDNIVVVESRSEIDELEVSLATNPAKYRAQKDMMFIEGLSQTIMHQIVYGTTLITGETVTAVDEISGWANRLNTLAANCATGGGSGGDTTSVYVVEWGVGKTYLVYPKGYPIAISREDLGRYTTYDAATLPYMCFGTLFKGAVGLVIEDVRAVQRIPNIEVTGASNVITPDLLVNAINRLPNRGEGNTVIYCNRAVAGYIEIASLGTATRPVVVTPGNSPWGGGRVMDFQGIPIHLCEALISTEVAVA